MDVRIRSAIVGLSLFALLVTAASVRANVAFLRGDTDEDGKLGLSDAVRTLTYLFVGEIELACFDSADTNDSGSLELTDGIATLNYLFLGGSSPLPPFEACGVDPTDDELTCDAHAFCATMPSEIERARTMFGILSTVAGKGEISQEGNGWLPEYEDGPAVAAELSAPHITLGDEKGNLYIADKEAHAIRRVSPDGTITTVAGIGLPGDDGDAPGPATERRLDDPNGLWVRADGVLYILDTDNAKVRKVDSNGTMSTLFEVPGLRTGRGLWVADTEDLAYVASRNILYRWTPELGVEIWRGGFAQLGNFIVEDDRSIVLTDRDAHRVHRLHSDGTLELLAENGATTGGGDGFRGVETGLAQVRGVWRLSELGGYLLATQSGSRIWYLDSSGIIHTFVDGESGGAHAGDGERFDTPGKKVSDVRSVTRDLDGNILITENDAGFVRRIELASGSLAPRIAKLPR